MNSDAPPAASVAPPELRRLSEMEIEFMRRRNVAIAQLLAGDPVAPDALHTVVFELLPQCRRAQESLATLPPHALPPSLVPLLARYVQLHTEAWQALARAFESREVAQIHTHERLLADAQRLIQDGTADDESGQPRQELRSFRDLLFALTPRIWAIPTLVAINVLVWAAMLAAGAGLLNPPTQLMVAWGANSGPLTLHGQWWRVVTCMFLHFGLLHLGFNMYVLWQLGRLVERLVGNMGLIILYLATGVAASIASLAWNPNVVSAGASGAVFGVCGALLGFIALRRDTIPKVVLMDLKSSLITFVIYNVVFSMVVPAIDMAAHLGGLVYGICCGLMLSQPLVPGARERRWRRNLLCLCVSALLLPVTFHLLPSPAPTVDATLSQIEQADRRVAELYREYSQPWQRGQMTDEALAQAVNEQMLPLVAQALREARSLHQAPGLDPQGLQSLLRYLTLRQRSLQILVRGLHSREPQALQQHNTDWLQADALQQKLFPLNEP